jgi:single-strand DNA-binding protein
MAATNINRVILTGNLTRDPELRSTQNGTSVCSLRLAVNTRRRSAAGEWEDKPNFFDITVWGAQGENCNRFLSKGRPVAVDGRLEWREYTDKQGNNRQTIDVIADSVQFLGGGREEGQSSGNGGGFTPSSDIPTDTTDFAGAPAGGGGDSSPPDDDIPF